MIDAAPGYNISNVDLLAKLAVLKKSERCVMADKYKILTKYIPQTSNGRYGDWVIDRENDGTPENPVQMPFVHYTDMVSSFIQDVYHFMEENKEMELNHYGEILKDNGLEWGSNLMRDADVSSLDGQCIMVLIMGAVRAERFCDGALLNFFKSGCIEKWLKRLEEIDKNN